MDNKVSVKIEFKAYGYTTTQEFWINWSPDSLDGSGVDPRITEWLDKSYRYAKMKAEDKRLRDILASGL